MYTEAKYCIVNSNVESQATGVKYVNHTDGKVDVNELHRLLNDRSCIVVIRNQIANSSETTEYQILHCNGKLKTEADDDLGNHFVDTYVFAMYSRTLTQSVNRKIIMSFTDFGKDAKIKCTYYNS